MWITRHDDTCGSKSRIVHTVNAGEDPNTKAFGVRFNAASPLVWLLAATLLIGGFVVARRTWRRVGKSWDEALIGAREKGFQHDVACS